MPSRAARMRCLRGLPQVPQHLHDHAGICAPAALLEYPVIPYRWLRAPESGAYYDVLHP